MIIERVLNNNAVSCLDELGNEIIVKGKGIAFKCSSGDTVDESKIQDIFVLKNNEISRRYQEIMVSIPMDCIETSEEIITMIKSEMDKKISDTIYVTLTDHISNLLERIQLGIIFDNSLLWDIKRMYKEEYQLGLKAIEIIKKNLHIKLDNNEANFIALHIVNAELDVEIKDVYVITDMIDTIYQLIKEEFDLVVGEEELIYTRFILHLRFFFERLIHQDTVYKDNNKGMLQMLQSNYPRQNQCVIKIIKLVENKFKNQITRDETLYLLIHVVKLTT